MAFSITTFGGHSMVSADGELDVGTATELRQAINAALDEGADALIVDLTRVSFLDSTTLGVFIGAYNRIRERGGAMGLVCPEAKVRRIFHLTGLDKVFTLFDTADDAAASLTRSP